MSDCINSKRWYVFYTYPKFERKVYEYLLKDNYEPFLPLHWVVRQWSDRKKRLEVPLFPNYIFIKIERNKIFEVLQTPKLISCVTFNRTPAFLRQKEVESIQQIVENDYPFEVSPNLSIGDSVVITGGALTGMEGILVEEKGNHRFALKIESLNQSVIVNIPSDCIEFAEVCV